MKLGNYIALGLLVLNQSLGAQNQKTYSSADILQQMNKLNTVGSVLYVAAHPDDENTRLLAYLANERRLRTGYLSLTRGDGGQNLIGKEQGELLGAIRTQELLAARRTDGAEQFFSRANDFGFSKNPEETFRIWNKDSILADVVWTIRNFKPDIIICRFPTTGEGGHGHHTASAILALEAFEAAADPKRFPEQLAYTTVWQAKRIFWNTFNFGTINTTAPDQVKIDVGVFNPLLGKSYGEIAAESRSMHKSQGFGSARARGEAIEYFKQLKGETVKTDLFENIDQTWARLPEGKKIQKAIEACIHKFNPQTPEMSVPALVAIYKQLQQLDEKDAYTAYWKAQKLRETENLILACSGLWLEATAADYTAVPGKPITVTAQLIARNKANVKLNQIFYPQNDTSMALNLGADVLYTYKHTETLSSTQAYSNPYWLNAPHTAGLFNVSNRRLIGKPENDAALNVRFGLTVEDLALTIVRPVVYKTTDPVKGEVYRPLEILPPVTINVAEKTYVYSGTEPKTIQFIVKANTANVSGRLDLQIPAGWNLVADKIDFQLTNKGDEALINVKVGPREGMGEGEIKASATVAGVTCHQSIRRIEYDHIPYQFVLDPTEARLVNVSLKKAGTNIGYITGAGDDVPASLKQVGYQVTLLNDDMLSNDDLSKYDAIVSGVRAYNTNDRLQVHYQKLMEYVRNGGNLVVQYNTNNRIGPVVAKIAPYPFTISRDRVTDENAVVNILKPDHPVLNYPNKIENTDFKFWIQERGIYFATELDKNYETIFSMNDPGEKASDGSLIIARYGNGNFVYTGLSFFRELPAGVSGAYRLFVNLLSLPRYTKQ